MRFVRKRRAVSKALVGGVVVVVVFVAGLGLYFAIGTPTPSNSSPSQTTSAFQSSAPTVQTTSSSSPSMGSSSRTQSGFNFTMSYDPANILLSPGLSLTYVSLTLAPPLSPPPSTTQVVILNASGPTGIAAKFSPASVSLSSGTRPKVSVSLSVDQSVSPGNYTILVTGKTGAVSQTLALKVQVVRYLVYMVGLAYNPNNGALSVKSGSTVYWINLDSSQGQDPGYHNVVFTSGSSASSSTMMQYDVYSQAFNQPGTYSYYCTFHPSGMRADLTVTP